MYPWKKVADPKGSAEHGLGTTARESVCKDKV